jgi:nitrate reductase gamma subunit
MSFSEFVEGIFFQIAAFVFLSGVLWRMAGLLRIKRKKDISPAKASAAMGFIKGNLRHFIPRGIFARRTWVHLVGGYAFHFGLLALIVVGAPHVAFLKSQFLGFDWWVMPRWGFIIASDFAFAGLILLWVRRISDPVMRLISEPSDHLGTGLTFVVMLTGCLALQESHDFLRAVHMLFVDLWLIYFPFSRLMHAFTFFLSRGNSGATYGRKGISL